MNKKTTVGVVIALLLALSFFVDYAFGPSSAKEAETAARVAQLQGIGSGPTQGERR